MSDDFSASAGDLSAAATGSAEQIRQLIAGQNLGGQPLTNFAPQTGQVPPIPRLKSPEMQQANRPGGYATIGERKRDEKSTLFHNIAGIVKSGADYMQEKKTRSLQMDIEKLMSATDGRNEAQQVLQDPNSTPEQKKEAEATVKKNTDIVNDIWSDPKKIKSLQKAFDINLLGESKNKKETAALMAAFKNYREGGDKRGTGELSPLAQKFNQGQPSRQQLNPQMQAQIAAIKGGIQPDANAKLSAMMAEANRAQAMQIEKMREANDLKIASLTANTISGGGVNVVDPNSITGISHLQESPDGKNIRRTPDVVLPSILPSTSQGVSTLIVADPNSPTGSTIVRIPSTRTTEKTVPGVGTVGAGGVVNKGGTQQTKQTTSTGTESKQSDEHKQKIKDLGLPPGTQIIAPKALSTAQVEKMQEQVTALEGTITRLKDLRQYTDIYSDMVNAGKVKLALDPKTGKRILGSFIPSTDREKLAAAAWQESAEYMNLFRQNLAAQGFRSIPSYDNMLNLRGQLFQDKKILDKSIDDSLDFLKKNVATKNKLLGAATTKDATEKRDNKEDPEGLFTNK